MGATPTKAAASKRQRPIYISLPPERVAQLDAIAAEECSSRSQVARRALIHELRRRDDDTRPAA
jgi:metal-responsive CopG/Arc/MetJ family transcriptional regulator